MNTLLQGQETLTGLKCSLDLGTRKNFNHKPPPMYGLLVPSHLVPPLGHPFFFTILIPFFLSSFLSSFLSFLLSFYPPIHLSTCPSVRRVQRGLNILCMSLVGALTLNFTLSFLAFHF
jgi:hypothetical protein